MWHCVCHSAGAVGQVPWSLATTASCSSIWTVWTLPSPRHPWTSGCAPTILNTLWWDLNCSADTAVSLLLFCSFRLWQFYFPPSMDSFIYLIFIILSATAHIQFYHILVCISSTFHTTAVSHSFVSFLSGFNLVNIPQSNRAGQAVGQIHRPSRPGRHSPKVLPTGAQEKPTVPVQSETGPQVQDTSKCMSLRHM